MAMSDVFGGAKTGNTIHYAFLDKSFTCFDNYNSDWLATNSLQKLCMLEISGVKRQTHTQWLKLLNYTNKNLEKNKALLQACKEKM